MNFLTLQKSIQMVSNFFIILDNETFDFKKKQY